MSKEFPAVLERMKAKLPPYLITALENQYNRLRELNMQIDGLEKQLNIVAKQNETPLWGKLQRLNPDTSSLRISAWCQNKLIFTVQRS